MPKKDKSGERRQPAVKVTDPRLVDAAALELTAAEIRLRAIILYAKNGGGARCVKT